MTEREFAKIQFSDQAAAEGGVDLVLRYATDVPLVVEGLLSALCPDREDDRILECGFGTGWLLDLLAERFPAARIAGIDLSQTFARAARARHPAAAIVCADMEAAPFADGAFDRVASCCALYFAADVGRALGELRRLAAPGGRVVMNTVSPDNLRELDAVSRRVLPQTPLEDVTVRYDMETGWAPTRAVFDEVERVEWRGEMALPDVETFAAYWASFHHRELAEEGERLLDRVRAVADGYRRSDGRVVLTRAGGAFIARV
jgi:SAM-dependent methyltransferase